MTLNSPRFCCTFEQRSNEMANVVGVYSFHPPQLTKLCRIRLRPRVVRYPKISYSHPHLHQGANSNGISIIPNSMFAHPDPLTSDGKHQSSKSRPHVINRHHTCSVRRRRHQAESALSHISSEGQPAMIRWCDFSDAGCEGPNQI